MFKMSKIVLVGIGLTAFSQLASAQRPFVPTGDTLNQLGIETKDCSKKSESVSKLPVICVIAETADQDSAADAVAAAEFEADGVFKIKSVLPDRAAEIRADKKNKAKESGFTHLLLVRVEHSMPSGSGAYGVKPLHHAYLTIKLYSVAEDEVVKTWEIRGVAMSSRNDDKDEKARKDAVRSAAKDVPQDTKIVEYFKKQQEKAKKEAEVKNPEEKK